MNYRIKSFIKEYLPFSLYVRLKLLRKNLARRPRYVSVVTQWTTRIVQSGPFRGMKYVNVAVGSTWTPKVIGCYEMELHKIIDSLPITTYDTIIDVGCAEGYYAVGMALKCPEAQVYAFDIDDIAQHLCRKMARDNNVDNRVRILGSCSPQELGQIITTRTLVICDCEGCEIELLRPDLVPSLKFCDIIVELHDVYVPNLTSEVLSRFEHTHTIELVDTVERDYRSLALPLSVGKLMPTEWDTAVSERRDQPMQWAILQSTVRS